MRTEAPNSHSIPTAFLVMAALVFAVIPSGTATAVEVSIPDPGLEAAIRDALGIPAPTAITDGDLASLTVLSADSRGITDLTGLEHCVNLQQLSLSQNNISELDPLAGLTTLTSLNLNWNNISELDPLAGLTNLMVLYLHDNNISTLDPLAGLASLTDLGLSYNNISALDPLSGLTNLTWLNLYLNNINHIQPLVDNPGLNTGDYVDLRVNPLSCEAINNDIPILQGRGVSVDFDPSVTLNVNISPRILYLNSSTRWVTCWISSPGCDPRDIDVASIRLEDSVEVQQSSFIRLFNTLVVKFDQSEVEAMLEPGENELTVTGEFDCGVEFQGTAMVWVRDPGQRPWFFGLPLR